MSLARYRSRRDFSRTTEPPGGAPRRAPRAEPGLAYVIQKHAARHLHYDFRLELDGVLLSWAVPKGPSLDPADKRLAVETEPHPLEYRDFEGTIPKGEYGAGTVMVWDQGTWTPDGDARRGLAEGRLSFTLHGQKLRGAWHLVRTGAGPKPGKSWLLIKSRDAFAREHDGELLETDANSVKTGRDLDAIARANDAVWTSHESSGAPVPSPAARRPRAKTKARPKARPRAKASPQRSARRPGRP